MRDLDPDRVDELVEVYRAHNEPLHASLESFVGMLELLPRLARRGPGARDRDREAAADDRTRVRPLPRAARDDRRRRRRRGHRAAQARPGPAARGAPAARGRLRRRGVRRRLALRRPRREGGRRSARSPSAGEESIPTIACSPRSRTRSSTPPRSCMPSSDACRARSRSFAGSSSTTTTATTSSTTPSSRTARTTSSTTSSRDSRKRIPSSSCRSRRPSGWAERPLPASRRCRIFSRWARSRR